MDQLEAAIQFGSSNIYCEFEDPKKYRDAVKQFRAAYPAKASGASTGIWVAPPRITKPSEEWILKQVQSCEPDGFLVRNYDHLQYYAHARCLADFSFNISNAWSAAWLLNQFKLERLTASYDLNIEQLKAFLASVPTDRLKSRFISTCPCFIWSTVFSVPFYPPAKTIATAAVPVTNIMSNSEIEWGNVTR